MQVLYKNLNINKRNQRGPKLMKEIREDLNKEVMDIKTPYGKMSIVLNEFIKSTQS